MCRLTGSPTVIRAALLATVGLIALYASRGELPVDSSFSPSASVLLSSTAPAAAADTTIAVSTTLGDVRPNTVVLFTPETSFIAPGPDHPAFDSGLHPDLAASVGTIDTTFTLGSANGACNTSTPVSFSMTNETVLIASLPTHIQTIFTPDGGATLQPLAHYRGTQTVGPETWAYDLVLFSPAALSAFPPPHPYADFSDPNLGYAMFVILSSPNSPVDPPTAPSAATDLCSQEDVTITLNGTASDGDARYTNPATGSQRWLTWLQSGRDIDGDGIENAFDTCPYIANIDGDPRTTSGADADMIDSACDLTPGTDTGSGNHDGDTTGAPWLNAGDNCPLAANSTQLDTELLSSSLHIDSAPRGGPKTDSIGDACDARPTVADGQFTTVLLTSPICIGDTDGDGDGWCFTDDPNDADANLTPELFSLMFVFPVAHAGSGTNEFVQGTITPGLGVDRNEASIANDGSSRPNNNEDGSAGPAYAGPGQPYQVCNDGIDNDGDTLIDLPRGSLFSGCVVLSGTLPIHPGSPTCPDDGCAGLDTDGDGFTDKAEYYIGTDPLGRCEVDTSDLNFSSDGPRHSTDWPADLDSVTILPNSVDRISITDITAFLAPTLRLGNSAGDANYSPRFDLIPGITPPFPTWIAINDLTALLAGSTGFPPMFSGAKAFTGPACTAHPTLGD